MHTYTHTTESPVAEDSTDAACAVATTSASDSAAAPAADAMAASVWSVVAGGAAAGEVTSDTCVPGVPIMSAFTCSMTKSYTETLSTACSRSPTLSSPQSSDGLPATKW